MKDPSGFRRGIALAVGGRVLKGSFLDTGAPHLVIFEEGLEELDVMGLGRALRHDPAFAPGGTNVNFVRIADGSTVEIRTYERGVESETLACGTGSVASALISSSLQDLRSPVTVRVRSGESLLVHFKLKDRDWTDVLLEGSAHMLFHGNLLYDEGQSIIRIIP
jgi:diaminopimelate epimerase